MQRFQAQRVLQALRDGSSCPLVVATEGGRFVTKLRGAPQGVAALVAELIASELAEALQLPVPERVLVDIPRQLDSLDKNDELCDLIDRSVGLNLGFRYLEGAVAFDSSRVDEVDATFAASILVLDNLIMNVDRTAKNPNLLDYRGGLWLVDHGAALPFTHWWTQVDEDSPGETLPLEGHLFWSFRDQAAALAPALLATFDRSTLTAVLARVPDEMLRDVPLESTPERTRAAYVAFLLKRARALGG